VYSYSTTSLGNVGELIGDKVSSHRWFGPGDTNFTVEIRS
jgi:hypothetical protein